jgi:hypothetical protein
MRRVRIILFACVVGLIGLTPGAAQQTRPGELEALASLQQGQWQLKTRGGAGFDRTICVGDTKQLIQVRHTSNACVRHVIANESRRATVHYKCANGGHAQTTVRVETPRLAQISSQGIADNEPFILELEARRVGVCTGGGGARGR